MSSTTPLTTTYSYDALGNLDTLDSTAYLYTSLGYANPHAATTIGGIPQAYDRNGNLASTSNRITNTWDYRNRLTESGNGISTSTFAYDHGPDRVLKNAVRYPNKFYNTDNAHTKHVFSPQGDLIATITGTTASTTATTTYAHTDHLGGTSATTNSTGRVTELSDFYPYGTPRVSLNYTGSPEQRKYAGTERDDTTSLDYMQHRYYRAEEGRFISQDPVYWEVGLTEDGKEILFDLPSGNSYGYARNNPLRNTDPTGRSPEDQMYYALNGMPAEVQTQLYTALVAGFGVPLATLSAPGTAMMLAAGVNTSPAFGGVVVGVALRATADVQQGEVSSPQDYAVSAALGAIGGTTATRLRIVETSISAAVLSATETRITDGDINYSQAGASAAGAAAGKAAATVAQTVPFLKPFSALIESTATFGATALTTAAVVTEKESQ